MVAFKIYLKNTMDLPSEIHLSKSKYPTTIHRTSLQPFQPGHLLLVLPLQLALPRPSRCPRRHEGVPRGWHSWRNCHNPWHRSIWSTCFDTRFRKLFLVHVIIFLTITSGGCCLEESFSITKTYRCFVCVWLTCCFLRFRPEWEWKAIPKNIMLASNKWYTNIKFNMELANQLLEPKENH